MSALPAPGQKRKATQQPNSRKEKKSRPEDIDPQEWLVKCGTADRVAGTKLRNKLKKSPEYMLLPSEDAKKSFLESRVALLMDNRDDAGISRAAQEAVVIAENVKREKVAREAEQELLRSTLAEMAGKRSSGRKGSRNQVRPFLKLLLLLEATIRILTSFSRLLYLQIWAKTSVDDWNQSSRSIRRRA